jgi:hypothetical protein
MVDATFEQVGMRGLMAFVRTHFQFRFSVRRSRCTFAIAKSVVALARSRDTAGLPNVPHAKLRGRWPRGDANCGGLVAATNVRRQERDATNLTPSELCSAQALQRRAEAGPRRLQCGVSRRF